MRLQRASRLVTNVVISLSLGLVACVLIAWWYRLDETSALNARTQSLVLVSQFAAGSDTLTAAVRGFAATGKAEYRDAFWQEVHVDRNRERALEGLEALGLTAGENRLLARAKRNSDGLTALQNRAFRAAGRRELARALEEVYSDAYIKRNAAIAAPMDEFRRRLDARLGNQAQSDGRKAKPIAAFAIAAAILDVLAIAIALSFYRTKVADPVAALAQSLSDLRARKPEVEIGFQDDRSEIGEIARALHSYQELEPQFEAPMETAEAAAEPKPDLPAKRDFEFDRALAKLDVVTRQQLDGESITP
jgi:two-component system, sensor histidine kinase and response regulator